MQRAGREDAVSSTAEPRPNPLSGADPGTRLGWLDLEIEDGWPLPQSMLNMAESGDLHIFTQGENKWERHQEGVGRDYERRPPGYPLGLVKRSQRRPRTEARLVPDRVGFPAYCVLQRRPRAVNGPEVLGRYGPVLVNAANGRGSWPRETEFDIHFCAT